MLITVKESVKGKFGPQLKDESGYLSFGKFYKGDKSFEPGTVLEADIFTTEKGNRYINSVTLVESAVGNGTPLPKKKVKTEMVKNIGKDNVAADWDKINRGKVKSLFIEALLSNPNVVQGVDMVGLLNSDVVQEQLNKLVESVF